MAKLARVTSVRTTCHFQTRGCALLRGTAQFLENPIEKNICKFYCACYWSKMVILPPAVPTSSMHHFSRKRGNVCKLTLSPLTPAWGLGGIFRSLRAKLYFTASYPLAWVVGKTYWYFHSESNCFKNNISSYCLQKARNQSTWSSKQFGWPCQLSNTQSSKQKHVRQDSSREKTEIWCAFTCFLETAARSFFQGKPNAWY